MAKKRKPKQPKKKYVRVGPKRSSKEKRRIVKRLRKEQIKLKTGNSLYALLNSAHVATLPLSPEEELIRQASVAGDFKAINEVWPISRRFWLKKIPLGKYRFEIVNGQISYIPFTEADIMRYITGPWTIQDPITGLAPMIHPRRNLKKNPINHAKTLKRFMKSVRKAGTTRAAGIFPGQFIYQSMRESTWTKIRKPVVIAAAVVASVYLGPQILAAVKSAYASAMASLTGGGAAAGTAAGTAAGGAGAGAAATGIGAKATLGAKIFAGAKTMTGYVNNARTIKAIAGGKMPPPPIGVSGDSFREWTFIEAKNQMEKELQRQITKDEEKEMRREIAQMQYELERLVPPRTPIQPSPALSPQIVQMQASEQKNMELVKMALMVGVPLLLLAKGF